MDDILIERYSRNILIPEIGIEGQKKILATKTLVVGMGAIGSVSSLYLAANGIVTIGICDYDRVELSNLQRQILYRTSSINQKKIAVAEKEIHDLNPQCQVNIHPQKLSVENVTSIVEKYDIIIDATDNPHTKFILNDIAVQTNKCFIFGGIMGSEGQLLTVLPQRKTACLRCLFPNPPSENEIPKCSEMGVVNSLGGIIASIQVTEVLKIILDRKDLGNEMFYINLFSKFFFKKIKVFPLKNCFCQKDQFT